MKKIKQVVAIDVGGTKIAAGVVERSGRVRKLLHVKTDQSHGPGGVFKQVRHVIHQLAPTPQALRQVDVMGIAVPGPLENGTTVVHPPNMKGWKRVDLRRARPRELQVPLCIENDANAAALAEYLFGAGKGSKCLLYITVSTGIGGGIVINGKILKGATGAAGEIGHTVVLPNGPRCGCGKRGCVEALASGTAIARGAKRSAEEVEQAARKGNRQARKVIESAGHFLGIAIGNAINLLNTDRVVVGGGVSQMGEMFLRPVRKAAKETVLPAVWSRVKIVQSKLGNRVGVLGAAAICFGGHSD